MPIEHDGFGPDEADDSAQIRTNRLALRMPHLFRKKPEPRPPRRLSFAEVFKPRAHHVTITLWLKSFPLDPMQGYWDGQHYILRDGQPIHGVFEPALVERWEYPTFLKQPR